MTEIKLRADAPWEKVALTDDYIVDKAHWIEYNPSVDGILGVRKFFDFREDDKSKYLSDVIQEEKQDKIDSKKNKNKNKSKKNKSELPDLP